MADTDSPTARPVPGLVTMLRAAPGSLVALTVLAALAGTSAAATTVAIAWFVDGIVAGRDAATLVGAAALFGGATLVTAVVPDVTGYVVAQYGRAARLTATARLYAHVGADPGIARLEDPARQDELTLAAEAADVAPTQFVRSALGCVQAGVAAVTLCWVMASAQPLVAAVALLGAIPVIVVEHRLAGRRVRLRAALTPVERRRQAYRSLIVDPVAAKEIRLFGLGGFFGARLLRDLRTADAEERRVDRVSLTAGLGLAGAQVALSVLVVALAVRGGAGAGLSAGQVTSVIIAFGALAGSLNGLVAESSQVRESLALLRCYDGVVREPAPVTAGTAPVPALRAGVELRDVWFRYGPNLPWVLRGVDLTVRAGESTALVGLNGAGKSTVVKLVCGLYQPCRGRVLWDGVDVSSVDPVALRERIGVVFQDYMAYDLTARENIGIGALSRIDDPVAVRAAALTAGIDADLAELPRGYDTLLSRLLYRDPMNPDTADPRVVLSGGQWQRLALARMFMRGDRDLLILDEPSAGLDAIAEHRVHRGVRDTMRGRARLLVSHRLSSVRTADTIAVIADGRIVERGDHDALVAADGRYAELFRIQASGYQDTPRGHSLAGFTG